MKKFLVYIVFLDYDFRLAKDGLVHYGFVSWNLKEICLNVILDLSFWWNIECNKVIGEWTKKEICASYNCQFFCHKENLTSDMFTRGSTEQKKKYW